MSEGDKKHAGAQTKRCSKCHTIRPLNSFSLRSTGRPQSWCKTCTSENAKRWSKRHPEKVRAQKRVRQKRYAKTEKGKATQRLANARYIATHPTYWHDRYLRCRDAELLRSRFRSPRSLDTL